jgi:hypothetical protein
VLCILPIAECAAELLIVVMLQRSLFYAKFAGKKTVQGVRKLAVILCMRRGYDDWIVFHSLIFYFFLKLN